MNSEAVNNGENRAVDSSAAKRQERQRYQWLIWALTFFLIVHLLALVSMALLVQPGFNVAEPAVERAAYIVEHQWLWRLGWLPWQLSALSDLLISLTLILWLQTYSHSTALKWAVAGLVFNLAASIPEQIGEWHLVTSHIETASQAGQSTANLDTFTDEQNSLLSVIGVWGGFVYLFMTLAWHRALRLGAGIEGWWSGFSGKLVAFVTVALFLLTAVTAGQVWLGWQPTLAITALAGAGFLAVCLWTFVAADLAGRLHCSAGLQYLGDSQDDAQVGEDRDADVVAPSWLVRVPDRIVGRASNNCRRNPMG